MSKSTAPDSASRRSARREEKRIPDSETLSCFKLVILLSVFTANKLILIYASNETLDLPLELVLLQPQMLSTCKLGKAAISSRSPSDIFVWPTFSFLKRTKLVIQDRSEDR